MPSLERVKAVTPSSYRDAITDSINMTYTAKDVLTKKQLEVAKYVGKGYTDREIANYMQCSINTVKTHLKEVYRKLSVSNRAELSSVLASEVKNDLVRLDGYWLSKFEYNAYNSISDSYIQSAQFNIEHLEYHADEYFNYSGSNLLSLGDRNTRFFHKHKCHVSLHHLVGFWENENSRNIGCFQLIIHNNNKIMSGMHLGNASNNTVQSGKWVWVKLHDPHLAPDIIQGMSMIDKNALDEAFSNAVLGLISIEFPGRDSHYWPSPPQIRT